MLVIDRHKKHRNNLLEESDGREHSDFLLSGDDIKSRGLTLVGGRGKGRSRSQQKSGKKEASHGSNCGGT